MSHNHSYMAHVSHDPDAGIACVTQTNAHDPGGYPVLIIGDATFFPTEKQLVNIHNAIEGYLRRNQGPAAKGQDAEVAAL